MATRRAFSIENQKMAEEATHTVSDSIVTEFATYEDFLDSQITQTDLYYLEVRVIWKLKVVGSLQYNNSLC